MSRSDSSEMRGRAARVTIAHVARRAGLTRGLADAVDAAGYGTYVCNTDGQHDRERKFFEDVMDRGADGIVFASGETASEVTFGPADYNTPIV